MTQFLLDSGDPQEYKEALLLFAKHEIPLWGSTTNPSLIAKTLKGKHLTKKEAFMLQKDIAKEILHLVPGAVSAEVYADTHTSSEDMVTQGKEIASWNKRMYVKLPTTLEGLKARATLRQNNIPINNTLVFSQQQSFAICLQEKILQTSYSVADSLWPSFISPFIGRLDDVGEDGLAFLKHIIHTRDMYHFTPWILAASIRNNHHIDTTRSYNSDIITAPLKAYTTWLETPSNTTIVPSSLDEIPYWEPSKEMLNINTLEQFFDVIESKTLDITHSLTDAGIAKFVSDWNAILYL